MEGRGTGDERMNCSNFITLDLRRTTLHGGGVVEDSGAGLLASAGWAVICSQQTSVEMSKLLVYCSATVSLVRQACKLLGSDAWGSLLGPFF